MSFDACIVFAFDSVMSPINIDNAVRLKLKKNRISSLFEVVDDFRSNDKRLFLRHEGHTFKIINLAMPGWAFADKIPSEAKDFIERERGGKNVASIFCHLGINSLRGDLQKDYSYFDRALIRTNAIEEVKAFVSSIQQDFPNAQLVWLGTSSVRNRRVEHDDNVFKVYKHATTEILQKRALDINTTALGLAQTFENKGAFVQLLNKSNEELELEDIADEWGHVTNGVLALWTSRLASILNKSRQLKEMHPSMTWHAG